MLGSGAIIVIDDSYCMVDVLSTITHFYHHESCGQCTPCREGTGWIEKIIHAITHGEGKKGDVDLLAEDLGSNERSHDLRAFRCGGVAGSFVRHEIP